MIYYLQTGAINTEYYSDVDLTLGGVINVWGRMMLLCDCDEFTKQYYKTKYGIGQPLNNQKKDLLLIAIYTQ